jgi:hypothetical protein
VHYNNTMDTMYTCIDKQLDYGNDSRPGTIFMQRFILINVGNHKQ